jgi:hypothetical protein
MATPVKEFTKKEMESAMDFVRKNPNAKFKDWDSVRRNTITGEDNYAIKNVKIFESELKNNNGEEIGRLAFLMYTGVGGGYENDAIKRVLKLYIGKEKCNVFVDKGLCNPWYRVVIKGLKNIPIEEPYKEDKKAKVYRSKLSEKSQLEMTLCFTNEVNKEGDDVYDKYTPWDIMDHYKYRKDKYITFIDSGLGNIYFQVHISNVGNLKFEKAKKVIEKTIKERS